MCAPLTGLIAYAPVATPVLGASAASAVRSRSLRAATPSRYAATAARCADVVMRATSGCSGASTTYVPPNSVSGRVVNTEIGSPVPTTVNVALAPIDLPSHSRRLLGAGRQVDAVELLDEPIRVRGDAQHPLRHQPLLDRVAGLDVLPIVDFLVREHGAERGAEVHRHLGAIREPALEQELENPLRPLVVTGIARRQLARPVVREAELLELALEDGDVARGDDAGVNAVALGAPLGGKPEAVPAHDAEHVEAHHALRARDDVGGRVTPRVSDMQPVTGRVREHVEHVVLGPGAVGGRRERVLALPVLLPLAVERRVVVRGHQRFTSSYPLDGEIVSGSTRVYVGPPRSIQRRWVRSRLRASSPPPPGHSDPATRSAPGPCARRAWATM